MTHGQLGYTLWLQAIHKIPKWELTIGILFFGSLVFSGLMYGIIRTYQVRIFYAFQKLKLRKKDLDYAFKDAQYIEITIPKNSNVNAFQVQQKIFKALHSTFIDPIEGAHAFKPTWYFFQKLFRLWRVYRAKQTFFTLQIWAQYPFISFRLFIPNCHFDRIEKAIFNAYPNAEITHLDRNNVLNEITPFHKSYLSYGQSTIEGNFYHRVHRSSRHRLGNE